jgi:hypothetical protein
MLALQREFLKNLLQGLGLLIELNQDPVRFFDPLVDLRPEVIGRSA